MTTYNARLINTASLRELIEHADTLSDLCNQLADPVSEYEDAEELPAAERTESRAEAREQVWAIVDDMRATWRLIEAWVAKREQSDSL